MVLSIMVPHVPAIVSGGMPPTILMSECSSTCGVGKLTFSGYTESYKY